jgi:hypothetical protein
MGFVRPAVLIFALATSTALHAEERTRFWNLTANTITHFYLSPAGANKFGPDQCPNDKDGTVDHDERLKITGIESGKFDAKFQDSTGRICIVKNIDIKTGGIFSIEESQATNCKK